MSSVIRPSGPLPPRVYWVRRLLLLAVVLILVGALWWLVSGLGNAEPDSPAGANEPAGTGNPPAGAGQTGTTDPHQGGKHHHHKQKHPGQHHPGRQGGKHHKKPELPASTGPCSASDVAISVAMDDATRGDAATARLTLTSVSTPACTLDITAKSLVLRILSVKDGLLTWTSDDCPDALPVRQLVVRTDPARFYRFRWDGHTSAAGCLSLGRIPMAGNYVVQVALIGGDVASDHFHLSP